MLVCDVRCLTYDTATDSGALASCCEQELWYTKESFEHLPIIYGVIARREDCHQLESLQRLPIVRCPASDCGLKVLSGHRAHKNCKKPSEKSLSNTCQSSKESLQSVEFVLLGMSAATHVLAGRSPRACCLTLGITLGITLSITLGITLGITISITLGMTCCMSSEET